MAIQTKFDHLSEQTKSIQPTVFCFNGADVTVDYKIFHTLFDQKCINAIMHNKSTVTCSICGLNSSDFHKDQPLEINKAAISMGICLLHCLIRAFEHLLHIGYRLTVRKWICRGADKGKFELCFIL